ncbi:MAG: hypothetical protein JST31_17410 [Actinobacteria bacterium]|nr:hypothetical protein [Actinomycetota bacterium]
MAGGRARAAALGAMLACALAAAGCGASTHPNEPRPAVSTRLSVVIQPHQVIVQRGAVANGPERDQQIPQNENAKQPPIRTRAPLDVTVVAANQTGAPTHLVIRGAREVKSGTVFARSPATFQAALPTGRYTVVASDIPGARPAHFTVGPYRASSQNDLLLP